MLVLARKLTKADINKRLLGSRCSCPYINLMYAHTNSLDTTKKLGGNPIEGSWRSRQAPLPAASKEREQFDF
jgi:phosphoketolase